MIIRCRYQYQGARNYVEVVFECPPPGLVGDTITLQTGYYRVDLLEIEMLG